MSTYLKQNLEGSIRSKMTTLNYFAMKEIAGFKPREPYPGGAAEKTTILDKAWNL